MHRPMLCKLGETIHMHRLHSTWCWTSCTKDIVALFKRYTLKNAWDSIRMHHDLLILLRWPPLNLLLLVSIHTPKSIRTALRGFRWLERLTTPVQTLDQLRSYIVPVPWDSAVCFMLLQRHALATYSAPASKKVCSRKSLIMLMKGLLDYLETHMPQYKCSML